MHMLPGDLCLSDLQCTLTLSTILMKKAVRFAVKDVK